MEGDGYFTTLDANECRELLKSESIGRIGWNSRSAGLLVLPVTYVCDGETVRFSVKPGSILVELAQGVEVAFEVDDVDVEAGNGWSVLVQGRSKVSTQPWPSTTVGAWVPGRSTIISLALDHVSGRAIAAFERNEL